MSNRTKQNPAQPASPYSAKRLIHVVHFFHQAPRARLVCIAGDFNDWRAEPMTRMPDGGWVITLELNHGHHLYHFLVDGVPTLDPKAIGRTHNERGEPASVKAVS